MSLIEQRYDVLELISIYGANFCYIRMYISWDMDEYAPPFSKMHLVQLPKHMHNIIILHCCYKLADNHLTLFQLNIRAVKAMGCTAPKLSQSIVTCKPQECALHDIT